MKEFKIKGVLYVEECQEGEFDNEEEKQWLIEEVLLGEILNIHSNAIGDTIGTLKITEIREDT